MYHMTMVQIDERGRTTMHGAKPGPYDMELHRDGRIELIPLVRATDKRPPKPAKAARAPIIREVKGRSWSKLPVGTVLTAPAPVGQVTLGPGGKLTTGRTPNQAFTDAGVTTNAWKTYRLDDGRLVGEAYDAGEWD